MVGEIRRKFEPDPVRINQILQIRETIARWKREGRFIVIDLDVDNLKFVLYAHKLSEDSTSVDCQKIDIPHGISIHTNSGNIKELRMSKKDTENLRKVGKQIIDQTMDLTRSVFGYPDKEQ